MKFLNVYGKICISCDPRFLLLIKIDLKKSDKKNFNWIPNIILKYVPRGKGFSLKNYVIHVQCIPELSEFYFIIIKKNNIQGIKHVQCLKK